ncbi:hypothetical protein LAZ67_2004175 [Cordylochernes scorpioides]|uniref:Integrase catalytic domain-containing protein n=1 Tax=Cordylochernes scorpioides TaxID=51811 RepID=A0ABY6K3N5_9ARAC|nr:hypothetical protein LAZ67_2004175 [Cordylochernes scorpioides]
MCPEKVNLLKTVSMSANTVARRVENIAENISSQLFDKNGHVEWFSLALDESTDVSDTAQVLIYIRGVDKSYEVHEELLDMYSIHGTTTGTDIFKGVEMAINKKNLRWKNLKCITTDGGKNMSGKDKGVVALVSKAVENDGGSKPLVLHCIIHQQSLSFGLNHRQFRQFIAEIGETDLPYHTAVRWLSCGKVLQRFFELRAVIEIFFNEKHRPLTELQNNAWLWKLAFYVDLTKHVNELNLRLQGENQHLPDLYTNIKSFRMKLILFQSQLRSKCFSHFKTCEIFSHTTETEFPIDFAIETLSALKINFDTRFSDFDAIAKQIKIFQNPFDAGIETLAPELQMEMIDLQCSDIIKNKYENSSLLEFYKSLPLTQFDNLHKFARGLFSVFGTTYLCEKTFSKMKYTKNVYRSKLTDEHLKSLLIIDFIFKYTNINELVRITAWIYRFVFNVQCSFNERKKGHLSSSQLTSSIHNIIRFIQSSEFQSEFTCCKQKKSLPTKSRLLSLNPFIDKSGLLRVGGRLRYSNLQFDEKHPIILPRDHFITELIVRQCHLDHLHSGLQLTMSALRLRYWIPAGRSLVKKIIHQCMVYFRAKRQVTKQIMGDLPMHRIVKSNPFTKTGIDFAGPFLMKPNIKRSKVNLKSYVALFVCFCTKAIHIEIVSDLSSAAFLAALKRFISRRGKPSDIFSDNGTNFRGANNILREQFGILKASTIQKFISNERINWHFIPSSAPNFGGIWEAGIKSFKFHFLRCLKSQILTFEDLSTLTTQIEACLNSRPICPLSSDSDDFNPLTPGHFLIGRPLTAPPESNEDDDVPINYLDRLRLNQKIKNVFWKRWNREYLNNLQQRLKWQNSSPNIKEGDLILLKDTISPPAMYWSLGRITKVFPGADGKVRVVEVKTKHQERLTRTVSKIVLLPFAEG